MYTDAVPTEQAGTKFSVFEEGAHAPTKDIMTPRHNTTALTAKKVGSFEDFLKTNHYFIKCLKNSHLPTYYKFLVLTLMTRLHG